MRRSPLVWLIFLCVAAMPASAPGADIPSGTLQDHGPKVPVAMAWTADGTLLVAEGERLGGLIYLTSGEAEVTLRGRPIAQCTSGSFIGEMSCFDGSPANATVSLRQPSRYFLIRTEALNRLCARDLDMRRAVENGVGNDTRHKLIETDLRLREAAGA